MIGGDRCTRCGYPLLRDRSCSDGCEPTEADVREDRDERDRRIDARQAEAADRA